MMKELGVGWATRHAMHFAVRRFGRSHWEEKARQKAAGALRIVPPEARPPEPSETWSEYRKAIEATNGNTVHVPIISPGFCSYTRADPKG
jgi:hypothetical protein